MPFFTNVRHEYVTDIGVVIRFASDSEANLFPYSNVAYKPLWLNMFVLNTM